MKFKFRHTDKLVGIFVLAALVMLLGVAVSVTLKQKMFLKTYLFHSRFNDAVGLTVDTPLIFKGFEIGKVKRFSLNKDNLIDVDIQIYREYLDKIATNSVISKSVNPVTGKCALEFLQGLDSPGLTSVGGFIPAMDSAEGRRLLAEGKIQRRSDAVFSIVNNIDTILAQIESDYTTPEGALFRLKNALADMSEQMNTSMGQLNVLLTALQRDHNPEDGALFRSLNNMADLTGEMKNTTRKVDSLLVSTQQLTKAYRDPDSLLVRMVDPTGANLIQPMHDTLVGLNANMSEMQRILREVYAQTPQIAALIQRTTIMLSEAQKTVEALNNNPILRGGISKDRPVEDHGLPVRATEVRK